MRRVALVLPFSIVFLFSSLFAQEDVLTEIQNVGSNEVKADGFVLASSQEINVHAVVANDRDRGIGTDAWILNKATREVVWKLSSARRHNRNRILTDCDDAVQLPAGEYEAYFSAYPQPWENVQSFGDFMDFLSDKIFDGRRRERDYADFSFSIHGQGRHVGAGGVEQWHKEVKKAALLSLSGLWDNDYVQQGFVLDKPAVVSVYALGEDQDGNLDDYGWIIDAETGKRIWSMSESNMKSGGGAKKNRLVRETLTLPAGKYAAFFVTDDSHSYRNWNAPPPYDPAFWGMTLWLKDESSMRSARLYDYKAAEGKNVIVDITRVGDNESLSRNFSLNKAMDVRIYALGEGRDGEMYDYGWIVDASTHKKIWSMDYDETSHAGGDKKNRLIDQVIHLAPGSYIAHFTTDGSHSYRNWNSAPPFDPEHWGITISAAGNQFDPKDVASFEDRVDPSVLARIVRVGNDEKRRKEFSLSQKSEIHIYALGEGTGGDMSDYAWIENANSGKVVWEMRYRMTDRAGGARKNRLFDGNITLPAGTYVVFYQTDDSHAYGDWNDTPPDDPESWGVTISLVKGNQR